MLMLCCMIDRDCLRGERMVCRGTRRVLNWDIPRRKSLTSRENSTEVVSEGLSYLGGSSGDRTIWVL